MDNRKKVVTSCGFGPCSEWLEISEPRFREFGKRHGFKVHTYTNVNHSPHVFEQSSFPGWKMRPPAWLKLIAVEHAFAFLDADVVLWLDADVVILDDSEDPSDCLKADDWQALVCHQTGYGDVPNTGVWLLTQEMRPVLEKMWNHTDLVQHGFWEQAALLREMGLNPSKPPLDIATCSGELFKHTRWLDRSFNVCPQDLSTVDMAHFWHGPSLHNRADIMRAIVSGVDWRKFSTGHNYGV